MRFVYLLLLAPALFAAQPPGELLPNRGFEVDADANQVADGWGAGSYGSEARVTRDETVAHEGQASMRIDGATNARGGVSIGFGPAVTDPSQVYLFSAWVRVDGESDSDLGTSARFTSVDAAGEVLASDYRQVPPGPRGWTRQEWLVTLPPATVRFNLVLFHHGTGTAWWDEVSLLRLTPLRATAPRLHATVPEARPRFAWEAAGPATISVSTDPGFAPEATRTWAATGGEFASPEPLEPGRDYFWRALVDDGTGNPQVTLAEGEEGRLSETPTFFGGTWEQRNMALSEQLAPYRELWPRLRAFAERNGMWDEFSLLGDTLQQAEALLAAEPERPAELKLQLEQLLAELDYTVPWWQSIFLDDAALFADLRLELPGLEAVRAAVEQQDWPAARQALVEYYQHREGPSWYARYETPPTRSPAVTTDDRAERLLTHQHPIHSYEQPVYDLGADLDWHVFPINDVEWPTQLNRHFHWSQLGAAYWRTGNERYAEELVQQLLDWAKDNPMERWDRQRYRWAWSTLNATVRIYSSWLNTWLQVKDSASWDADAQFVFLTELREHGRFLMTQAASHGNWVVAEARGLVELGVTFPEFKEAEGWRNEGYERLRRELELQVLSDGVHVERTPGYHSMTMDCFMEPVRLGLLNGVEVPGRERFVEKLEQMHEYYLYGVKPNGRMPQIGDSGPMAVAGQLRRGAEMFRRADMLWVLTAGAEGEPPVHRSYAFDGAGQYNSRSGWNDPNALWSTIDWGGFLGHCHEDMGQIGVYAYGSDLLIDTGRFSYARPMRDPFYETSGHNTVMVDGETQKRRDPLSAVWTSGEGFDYFRGTTDNSEPLLHERQMVFRQPTSEGPGYWLVVDRLSGEGEHRLDQRWHPTEKLTGRVDGATVVYTGKEDGQPSLALANLPQPGLEAALVEGAVSYEWYQKIPVEVAEFTLAQAMPGRFVTVLYPTPPGIAPARVEVRTADGDAAAVTAVIVTVTDRGATYEDHWLLRHQPGTVTADGVTTDAELVYRRRIGAARTSWFAAGVSRLAVDGETLFAAAAPVESAGLILGLTPARGYASAGEQVQMQLPTGALFNGAGLPAPAEGWVTIGTVAPAVVRGVPKLPGEPRFEIEPPAEAREATSHAAMQPAEATLPAGAIKVQAEDFTAQGGGVVEVTAVKIGAEGKSFLHWDHEGQWLEWTVTLPAAGAYTLWLRAAGAEMQAVRALTINGQPVTGAEAIAIPGTGGWSSDQDDWRSFEVRTAAGQPLRLELPAGPVTLRLTHLEHSLNLDWLALVP